MRVHAPKLTSQPCICLPNHWTQYLTEKLALETKTWSLPHTRSCCNSFYPFIVNSSRKMCPNENKWAKPTHMHAEDAHCEWLYHTLDICVFRYPFSPENNTAHIQWFIRRIVNIFRMRRIHSEIAKKTTTDRIESKAMWISFGGTNGNSMTNRPRWHQLNESERTTDDQPYSIRNGKLWTANSKFSHFENEFVSYANRKMAFLQLWWCKINMHETSGTFAEKCSLLTRKQ